MRRVITFLLGLALLGQSAASWAASGSEESTVAQIGYGTGSVVGSVVYFPFKAAFCILGAIGGGFTLVVAGPETANKVVSASCRGTWVITPAVVKGQEEVKFVGDVPAPKAER